MNAFQKIALIATLLAGHFLTAQAQQHAVSADRGRGDEHNIELRFTNNLYVPIILRVTFEDANSIGGGVLSPYTTAISARGVTSITLPRKENANYRYSYRYWWGCRNPKVETDYPYLIPVGKNGETKVSKLVLINKKYGMKEKVPAKSYYATSFYAPKGDTVYAARRGTVFNLKNDVDLKYSGYTMSTEENAVHIMHKDCSYAWYSVLSQILVKDGQEVEAGQPIAIVGGDKYASGNHVRFSVIHSYYCDTCDNRAGAYGKAFVKPKFYQSNGAIDTLMRNSNIYTAAHPDEIITREMSRRELKKWRKAHLKKVGT
ncbi:MAG: M23 family metallopeptidase [Prevotellaceae bacterium]|jgi:biotin carboxyl carrier protein|nr:M23 family metallopeptidase [Prevotellaceae bacterium]